MIESSKLLEICLLTKKLGSLLFAIVIIPVTDTGNFLDLKYSDIKPNKAVVAETVTFEVDSSASPFFVKVDQTNKIEKIKISGKVVIDKAIADFEKDSYFQLGIIYAGDYKPGGFVRTFLPEWLKIVLSLSKKDGVGEIDFFDVSPKGQVLDKKESNKSIQMTFKTAGTITQEDGKFELEVSPKKTKILGLWLRSDGDDSSAKFKTTIENLKIN